MAVQPQYLAYVLEQLESLGPLRQNRMFGGVGLYSDGLFFGFIDDDTLFFKADARNLDAYLSRRMPRFMAAPTRPAGTPGYYQVPADVIEDPEALASWARAAVQVALAARSARPKRPRRAKSVPVKRTPAKRAPAKRRPKAKRR